MGRSSATEAGLEEQAAAEPGPPGKARLLPTRDLEEAAGDERLAHALAELGACARAGCTAGAGCVGRRRPEPRGDSAQAVGVARRMRREPPRRGILARLAARNRRPEPSSGDRGGPAWDARARERGGRRTASAHRRDGRASAATSRADSMARSEGSPRRNTDRRARDGRWPGSSGLRWIQLRARQGGARRGAGPTSSGRGSRSSPRAWLLVVAERREVVRSQADAGSLREVPRRRRQRWMPPFDATRPGRPPRPGSGCRTSRRTAMRRPAARLGRGLRRHGRH
jgi:hypothetical protein